MTIELVAAPAHLPEGRRVYAIGDIHGCDIQLGNLHAIVLSSWGDSELAHREVVWA